MNSVNEKSHLYSVDLKASTRSCNAKLDINAEAIITIGGAGSGKLRDSLAKNIQDIARHSQSINASEQKS